MKDVIIDLLKVGSDNDMSDIQQNSKNQILKELDEIAKEVKSLLKQDNIIDSKWQDNVSTAYKRKVEKINKIENNILNEIDKLKEVIQRQTN